MKHSLAAILMVLVLSTLAGQAKAADTVDKAELIRQFQAAFNAHNPEAMAALVAEDIQSFSVAGGSMTKELEGKAALVSAMTDYFGSCTSCQSELKNMMFSAERAVVLEVASWDQADGRKSQQSLAVYEFNGALIQRVYYYPAEPLAGQPDG